MSKAVEFALKKTLDIPESALSHAALLLLDTLGVAAAATKLEAGRIARDTACELYGASADNAVAMLFDGREVSNAGAAFAAATQIDNLDAHDGYNPTKGHIGCAVIPALFAFAAQRPELTGQEALTALVIAYEIAARAGIALHATVTDYHTSGAWNALGVAAMGCRLLGADHSMLRHALGIAEYHGPRSQMMREINTPTMLHDGSGIGALTGVMAVTLALRGFQGAPAITVEDAQVADFWADLGENWTIESNYIKPYPICRWAHAAIDAVYALQLEHKFTADDVTQVKVNTFTEAAQLFPGMPQTTSQAQYSLRFAVATMLRYGHIGVEHITSDALSAAATAALIERIEINEDRHHSDRFPAGRWSDVTIALQNGQTLSSGDVHARGGLESPMSDAEIKAKFDAFCQATLSNERTQQIWLAGQQLIEHNVKFDTLSRLVSQPCDAL